ncbi:hypothetical protein GVAV_001202 [Gurleya vavrai]
MLLLGLDLFNLLNYLILFSIIIINCDTDRIIHVGNLAEFIQDNISQAINENFRNSESTDDLYIIIQNCDKESKKLNANLIYELIKKYFSIEKCDFEMFCNLDKNCIIKDTFITIFAFYEFLNNLYHAKNIKKFDKINFENHTNFIPNIEQDKNNITLIHNKKFLSFQTFDELYLNIINSNFIKNSYDLTILVLENTEPNIFKFIEDINCIFETFINKTNQIDIKILYNQKLLSFCKNFPLTNTHLHILTKNTKETCKSHDIYEDFDIYINFKKHFLYEYKIMHSKRYPHIDVVTQSQYNLLDKRNCYLLSFQISKNHFFEFRIFTETKIEEFFENNKILLKETVFIVYFDLINFHELTRFTYYIEMNKMSFKKNSIFNIDKKIENIKFARKGERLFFNQKLKNKYEILENDDNILIINLMINKRSFHLQKELKGVYYNDPTSNQNNANFDDFKNIAILNVLNKKCDEVNVGQKNSHDFFLRLKNIFKSFFFNPLNIRNDIFVLDTNFLIDYNEKLIAKKLLKNILINENDAKNKIKNCLIEIFKNSEISDAMFYDFKPLIYTENYNFDSTKSVAFIDKQNQCVSFEFNEEKSKLLSANSYDISCFLRFFFIIKKKFKNKDILFYAQFYYFEDHFKIFCDWAEKVDIKKLYFENFGNEIIYGFTANLLFGLVLNEKYRMNIVKGICYDFFIPKDTIIQNLVNQCTPLIDFKFQKNLKDFISANVIYSSIAIQKIDKVITDKLISLESFFHSNERKTAQDLQLFEDTNKNFIHISKFKQKHSILVDEINETLLLIFVEFKKFLLSQNYNRYSCILTKSFETEIKNNEFDSELEIFEKEILKKLNKLL